MNYSELIQAMQDWVESNETTMVSNLDLIIEFAEKRIYRSTDLSEVWKYQQASLAADDEFVSLPSDTVVIRSLQAIDGSNNRTFLRQKDLSFLDEYNGNRTTTGTPVYWGWYNDQTLMVAPPPSAEITLELAHTVRPTQLSGSNTTTWLSTNAPDVLLYACLMELATFLKEEPDIIQEYEKKYQAAYQALIAEENIRNRTDAYETGEIQAGGQ